MSVPISKIQPIYLIENLLVIILKTSKLFMIDLKWGLIIYNIFILLKL